VIADAAGTVPASQMHDRAPGSQSTPTGPAPVSVHFVNNVLAAAASYIEVEPDTARDVLAELGAFLSHRLRPARIVPLSQELDHVAVYVRLEQARFPGRLEAELPSAGGLPSIECAPGEVQAPLADALGRWLGERRGRVRLALRARLDGSALEAQFDEPDDPAATAERVRIALSTNATGSAA
jgi:two-component system, LytTR family, sensor kinase